ncbi:MULTISPECIES: NAD(P)-dependent oxidoreductase [unclassified Halorubrum]|uniref:NAD-dependent epimerase/dehydratase family protein n=1 Tax=unclassified Halorubrum TaxID=2642239 RepID=UPI0010F9D3DB|nr:MULTISPECIES: NAD(P)-dependent oxidoreductase [unclassified Halorubrum]TKX44144.1 NAD(P)-dependent oxidoreductase [Halorubrum sp. ARQ200]TKX50948.1 NAD(P)-dependent oxidoreductase [Halorubrum sp. ASP121]
MDTVLVTGSAGGVGARTVDALADAGREVVAVDRRTPPSDERRDGVDYAAADLTDYGETRQVIGAAAPDAVVHLAAIPHPEDHAGSRVFANNVESAYNVFDAAGAAGARIAWASSESCYGTVFADDDWLPERLPIDQVTPTEPEDPYGLSKVVGEEVAAAAARRHGVPVVSLRLSWVTYPGGERRHEARETFDPATAEPSGNCWSYVDVRDAVSAIEAAIDPETDIEGHEAVLIVAAENFLGRDTAATIEAVRGDLPADCDLDGDESVFDCTKAERLLGWEPEHSWRDDEANADENG